ncbi:CapA family protein [Marinobacter psychrophilus]|uniref:CapA family protein n=1 Tax=Marinobacter psychrophilus TaxID=330734 RepID=UPI001B55637F|nr:CapA family protein [Marinobacter psychrophilus]MBQ0762756.1 CapA family protein [Marinobacter psychrophilus]MBQ0844482.1 CapA family protein [Marinobacter psychrophilus]
MRIMFVGDINLGEYYTSFGHGPKSYLEHSDVFENVRDLLSRADFVVGNLEAPLTTHSFNPTEPESVVLRGDPKHATTLRAAGFRVLQVANNHTVQHGEEGFRETVEALSNSGVIAVGLNEQKTQIIEIGGETVGFLAASDVPDNTDKAQRCYQRLDDAFVTRAIKAVAEVDHLFVLLHWGLESCTSSMAYQKNLIRTLSQSGVRGVIGSHPHLFYEVWIEGQTVAAPSLGNFIFDLCWDKRLLQSGILDVTVDKDTISSTCLWPLELLNDGCCPSICGSAVPVQESLMLYDLGKNMSGEQSRKLKYFFRNLFRGNQRLKVKFIVRKLLTPLTRHYAGNDT